VIDSCHAGALLGDGGSRPATRGDAALENRGAIDRLMAKTGRAMLVSTAERKYTLEGHGVFTHVLLEGLRGRADQLGNRNYAIETSELADYLEEVPRVSHRIWRYKQHLIRDFRGQSFPIGLRQRNSMP